MGRIIVMSKFLLCFVFFSFFFFGCSDQLLLSSSSFSNSSTKLCPHGQALALLQFKQSFSIDHNSSSSCYGASYPKTENWKEEDGSEDCCSWDGVTCDLVTGQVIELDLSCSWLSGTIHPNTTLFLFSHHLQSLNLAFNNFYMSSASAAFGHFSNLVSLDLSGNFGVEFAPLTFDSLVQNLTKLQKLHLTGISISSVLPNSFLNRSSLISLDLSFTELHGRFPDHHDIHLPKLQLLSLQENYELSGNFPRFSENNSLIHLDLSSTNFSGVLPASMANIKSLQILDLSHSQFSGSIPTSIGNLTSLRILALSNCQFSGSIPASVENLTQIFFLGLNINRFSGKIPNGFGNLINLIYLFLSRNNFSGQIPASIGNLTNLRLLDLSRNNFGGMLPHCLGNFSKDLSVLNLRRNQFHGTIPQTFLKGNSIWTLDFNGNQLEGLLPRSLIICRELEVLDLGNNKINDSFPHWLGALPDLQVLVLRSNHFHGHIGSSKIKSPFMSLRIIDLAHNDFEGDLPKKYLRSLKAMMNIDEGNMTREYMGKGYYQDSVMTIKGLEIEFVKILNTFTTIDLSSNKFQGGIPECIGILNSLRELNLSHNNFTGHIPLSFRNLKMLESLDLSSNNLIGRIPEELTSLTFLEVLNLSQNHLSGLIPLGNQFSTFGKDSYYGNSGLCGFPLSKRCISIDETPGLSKEEDAEFENKFDWKFMLMGYGCGLIFGLSVGGLIFLIGKPRWLVTMVEDNIHKKITRPKRSTYRRVTRRN